jgi:hypothetical protein
MQLAMSPSSSLRRTAAAFVFVALLGLASSSLLQLQAARTTPSDGQGRVDPRQKQEEEEVRAAAMTTSSRSGSTPASASVQESPPPTTITVEEASSPPRSRMLGSVPSPGVGH